MLVFPTDCTVGLAATLSSLSFLLSCLALVAAAAASAAVDVDVVAAFTN